ncbi:hypothetical protein Scep_030335 [Stephania cephalantha]|uniref:Uncharacterized protein n=1 Tax=Stephania cephalantha TaxID=152367 RepID=A0AAP0HE96_9MAGN
MAHSECAIRVLCTRDRPLPRERSRLGIIKLKKKKEKREINTRLERHVAIGESVIAGEGAAAGEGATVAENVAVNERANERGTASPAFHVKEEEMRFTYVRFMYNT